MVRKPGGGGVRGEGIRRRPSEFREVGHAGRTCDSLIWNRASFLLGRVRAHDSDRLKQTPQEPSTAQGAECACPCCRVGQENIILHFPSNFVEHLLRIGQNTSRVKETIPSLGTL